MAGAMAGAMAAGSLTDYWFCLFRDLCYITR
jgi:hypothetical protein